LLWRFLAGTGLRLNEARGLTVGNLTLDGDRPGIDLPASLTKAKQRQYVPLRPDLADRLRHHIEGRRPTDRVFTIPADILRRFKADCKRAGIPLKDDRGRVLDIHALRMSFIDGLVKAGVPPRIVQELARHSDISITMRHYTDIRVHDLHAAVALAAPSVAPSVAPTGVNSGATVAPADNIRPQPKTA
jgi:integrase